MIQHIVLFKFKENLSNEVVENTIQKLRDLEHIVSGIRNFSVGIDYTGKSKGYTIGLSGIYESKEHLQEYYVHPQHLQLVKELKDGIAEDWIANDYEL
jgi:hypothetical protein